jgi:type IV pilus assembly protein PilC
MRPMLKMLCRQLESGQSLSQAVALHSSYFSAGFCLALAAGEQSGMLDTVLARLALDGEKRQRLRIRVRSALMYPLTILLMALMVTALMLLTVIPAFAQAFATAGQALPRATRWVIALSDNLRTQGPVLLVGMCLLLLAVQCGWRRYPGWRLATDRLVLRLPCVGVLWQQLALVRWSRTLSMLLAAGVPLLNALQSAGQVAGNRVYLAASCQVATLIQQGCGLTAAMRQCACFPALLLQLAAVGEASGAMDQMFERAARYYEEQVDDSLQLLSSVLGPLAMALLGGLCAALIWVLYLPIFQLGQVLG